MHPSSPPTPTPTPTPSFDHERLIVYRKALEFVAWTHKEKIAARATGSLKDQIARASISIPLNIAEGNGKSSSRDRVQYLEIARGSALECAACLDVLRVLDATNDVEANEGKQLLLKIVRMITALARSVSSPQGSHGARVREEEAEYGSGSREEADEEEEKEQE